MIEKSKSKRIIVVDDDPTILEVIQIILEDGGYNVTASSNGDIFKDLKDIPDLILLDVLLSGEDGRDIVKGLKGDDKTKKIPVIMISAHPSGAKTSIKAGANDFISKPFDMDDLLAKVARYVNS